MTTPAITSATHPMYIKIAQDVKTSSDFIRRQSMLGPEIVQIVYTSVMASTLMRHLPFSSTTTPLQATTYLLGIALFSISFLVFLNSSVSFVITDVIGVKRGVGDIVGTLGFVDELVALIACPLWGLVSDRLGVRLVAVVGYAVIALALVVFVQARNVYPQLLLARILFAVGATAAATMVTAILPSVADETEGAGEESDGLGKTNRNARDSLVLSMESEATITPERFQRSQPTTPIVTESGTDAEEQDPPSATLADTGKSSVLAGYVGLFTGCGALVALVLFLPLPGYFGKIPSFTVAQAISYGFYVVASIAFLVAIFVFFGLRHLRGEEGKGWRLLLGLTPDSGAQGTSTRNARSQVLPYWRLLSSSVRLGFADSNIALGYLGGFVARASTVAISLFIPLYVNAYFIGRGFCQGSPNDPSPDLKRECRQAYVLSAVLTGVAQLVGLLLAPVFGYLSRRRRRINWPVILSTGLGIWGYVVFPTLNSPEIGKKAGQAADGGGDGSPFVLLVVSLIGISQIGAIVCSLGSLGRGVLTADMPTSLSSGDGDGDAAIDGDGEYEAETESDPLLRGGAPAVPRVKKPMSRVQLKGSIAGVYSWCGGAAILLLTKLGGYLFDSWTMGAPFYMMAIFNGVMLAASLAIDVARILRERRDRATA